MIVMKGGHVVESGLTDRVVLALEARVFRFLLFGAA